MVSPQSASLDMKLEGKRRQNLKRPTPSAPTVAIGCASSQCCQPTGTTSERYHPQLVEVPSFHLHHHFPSKHVPIFIDRPRTLLLSWICTESPSIFDLPDCRTVQYWADLIIPKIPPSRPQLSWTRFLHRSVLTISSVQTSNISLRIVDNLRRRVLFPKTHLRCVSDIVDFLAIANLFEQSFFAWTRKPLLDHRLESGMSGWRPIMPRHSAQSHPH